MAIHGVDRARAQLKQQIAALNACVQLRALFPPEALAAALQQLVTRCAALAGGPRACSRAAAAHAALSPPACAQDAAAGALHALCHPGARRGGGRPGRGRGRGAAHRARGRAGAGGRAAAARLRARAARRPGVARDLGRAQPVARVAHGRRADRARLLPGHAAGAPGHRVRVGHTAPDSSLDAPQAGRPGSPPERPRARAQLPPKQLAETLKQLPDSLALRLADFAAAPGCPVAATRQSRTLLSENARALRGAAAAKACPARMRPPAAGVGPGADRAAAPAQEAAAELARQNERSEAAAVAAGAGASAAEAAAAADAARRAAEELARRTSAAAAAAAAAQAAALEEPAHA